MNSAHCGKLSCGEPSEVVHPFLPDSGRLRLTYPLAGLMFCYLGPAVPRERDGGAFFVHAQVVSLVCRHAFCFLGRPISLWRCRVTESAHAMSAVSFHFESPNCPIPCHHLPLPAMFPCEAQ